MPRASSENRTAVIRADASESIGGGHVTRCLALAEALSTMGWKIVFATRAETAGIVPALENSGFETFVLDCDVGDEPGRMQRYVFGSAALLIVDHYERDRKFEQACRTWSRKIVVMDEGTGRNHDCDFLVDAAAANADVYAGRMPSGARVLFGPQYALLRRAFAKQREASLLRRDGRTVGNIFVSFGATDPVGVTPLALEALAGKFSDVSVTIALSSKAKCLETVRAKLDRRSVLMVDHDNVPALMANADLAIGAAGAMSYERAALGLPSILVVIAGNQQAIGELMAAKGAALHAGQVDRRLPDRLLKSIDMLMGDANARMEMAKAGSSLVDLGGPTRVSRSITS